MEKGIKESLRAYIPMAFFRYSILFFYSSLLFSIRVARNILLWWLWFTSAVFSIHLGFFFSFFFLHFKVEKNAFLFVFTLESFMNGCSFGLFRLLDGGSKWKSWYLSEVTACVEGEIILFMFIKGKLVSISLKWVKDFCIKFTVRSRFKKTFTLFQKLRFKYKILN